MLCIAMGGDRSLIEAATGQALSPIEWTGLLLLLILLVGLIAVLPGGTILGAVVAGVLAGILVTFMVLLRKLDRLRWHERSSIWEPTARLFRSMGRDPYVPREVIESGRFVPTGRVPRRGLPRPVPGSGQQGGQGRDPRRGSGRHGAPHLKPAGQRTSAASPRPNGASSHPQRTAATTTSER